MTTRDAIWSDILRERDRQDRKHGPDLPPDRIAPVLGEEFGEVCEAINDHLHRDRLREELVQCAAVCVKAIEHLERQTAPQPQEGSAKALDDVGTVWRRFLEKTCQNAANAVTEDQC